MLRKCFPVTIGTGIVEVVSSTTATTAGKAFEAAFNSKVLGSQDVYAFVEGSNIFLASKFAGSGATLEVSSANLTNSFAFSGLNASGNADGTTGGGKKYTASGFTANSTTSRVIQKFPQQRALATISSSGSFQIIELGTSRTVSSIASDNNSRSFEATRLDVTISSGDTGSGCILRAANDTSAYLEADAEL